MTNNPDHDEVRSLLASYAIDAVEPDERTIVEAHLSTCSICVTELADHLRVATALARIERERGNATTRLLESVSVAPGRARARWPTRLSVIALALALAVLLTSVFFGVSERTRLARLQSGLHQAELTGQVELALANPSARRIGLHSGTGQIVLSAVAEPTGAALVFDNALPTLPPGQMYELWRIEKGGRVPAAALGRGPQPAAFQITPETTMLAITVESAGGQLASDHALLAMGSI